MVNHYKIWIHNHELCLPRLPCKLDRDFMVILIRDEQNIDQKRFYNNTYKYMEVFEPK